MPNPSKPNRRSVRIPGFNYAQDGAYYITICTHERRCIFGSVVDFTMRLSDLGHLIEDCWHELLCQAPSVRADEWVIMPNHLHALLFIDSDGTNRKPLGSILAAFKSSSTSRARQLGFRNQDQKLWQRNYYEQVLFTERRLMEVRQYIRDNPVKWALDRDNPVNW